MTYFNSRELAAASLFASLWGVLNAVFSPVVFRAFGLPILCDMLGFAALSLTFWWVGKFGAATVVGFVATLINFILNPGGLFFLGFTAASIVFDVATSSIGYKRVFRNSAVAVSSLLAISIGSAAIAGLIIGSFFMGEPVLVKWGGVYGWAGLHALGGVAGGLIGAVAIGVFTSRQIHGFNFKNWGLPAHFSSEFVGSYRVWQ